MALSASRTSSSLKGLTIAVTIFMVISRLAIQNVFLTATTRAGAAEVLAARATRRPVPEGVPIDFFASVPTTAALKVKPYQSLAAVSE